MANSANIFAKGRLTPGQLRAVADRRFDDAKCLLDSGVQQRANGVMYMAGFVIECLLKAILLDRHPNLQLRVDPATLSPPDREVYGLLYSHELDRMLEFLPEVEAKLSASNLSSGVTVWTEFSDICEEWTIYARYSPKQAKLSEAEKFLKTIEEVKKWLGDL